MTERRHANSGMNDLNVPTSATGTGGSMLSLNIRVDEELAPTQVSIPVPSYLPQRSTEHVRSWLAENIHAILDQMEAIKESKALMSSNGQHRHVISDVIMDDLENFCVDVTVKPDDMDMSINIPCTDDEVELHVGGIAAEDTATSGMDTPRSTSSESGESCDLPRARPKSSVTVKNNQMQVTINFPQNATPPRSAKLPRRRRNGDRSARSSRGRLSYPTEETRLTPEMLTEAHQAMDSDMDGGGSAVADSGLVMSYNGQQPQITLSVDLERTREAKQNILEALQVLEEANSQLKERNQVLTRDLDDVRVLNEKLSLRLRDAEETNKKLIEENDEYKIARDQMEKDIMRLQGQVTSTWEEKTRIQEMFIKMEAKALNIEAGNEDFRRQLEQKAAEVTCLRKRLSGHGIEWVGQIEKLKDEINQLKAEKAVGLLENTKMKAELENLKAMAEELHNRYEEEKKKHGLLLKSFQDIKDSNNNLKLRSRLRRNSIGNAATLPMKPPSAEGLHPAQGGVAPPKPITPPKVLPDMLTKKALHQQQFRAKFEHSKSMTETFPPLTRRK